MPFADDPTLQEAGELEALRRLLPQLPAGTATLVGPGDDAAVVAAPDGRFVVTTDTMLEGADFRLDWSSWHDLGWKAVATNLSDVAAMGAAPTSIVVALGVTPETRLSALDAFAAGLTDAIAAMAPGCGVVGGDLGTAPHATIAVTAFGDLCGRAPVLRSGARPTDAVWCVGALGLAATGLRALFAHGDAAAVAGLREGPLARAAQAQLAPVSPVAAGAMLADLGATAMLDVSDGLALDAARVARASGVRIALTSEGVAAAAAEMLALDHAPDSADDNAPEHSLDAALHGGEDHALLFTLPAGVTPPERLAGHPVSRLGTVAAVDAGEAPGITLDGKPLDARGWDPYRAGER